MLENIRLAFQGVWSHKLRSMLTMLGIIIGIASIISIVSTIQGTNEQIKQNLIGGGNNTVDVELYRADEKIQVSDYEQAPRGVPTITDDILQEIKDVDGVESAAAYYSRSYADSIYYNNNSLQGAQVLGVDNNYFSTTGYVVRTGRTFREEDYKEFHKVVILDQSAATIQEVQSIICLILLYQPGSGGKSAWKNDRDQQRAVYGYRHCTETGRI